MAAPILTQPHANRLYDRGLAILDGTYNLTTRTAIYDWNPTTQQYERTHTGLRVQHRRGARWNGARFVRCLCDHCARDLDPEDRCDVAD